MKKEDSRVLVILFSNEFCLLLLCDAVDPGADSVNTLQLAVTLNKEDPVSSVQLVSSDLLEDLVIFYLWHYFWCKATGFLPTLWHWITLNLTVMTDMKRLYRLVLPSSNYCNFTEIQVLSSSLLYFFIKFCETGLGSFWVILLNTAKSWLLPTMYNIRISSIFFLTLKQTYSNR